MHLFGKKGSVVVAVHELEHGIGATLQRNVEMRHKGTRLGAKSDNFVGEQVGLNARYAEAFNFFYLVESAQQINELLAGVFAKVADIHTGNHDFLAALGSHFARLPHKALNGAAPASSARHRNGAIGAKIVASVLHLQPIACAATPLARWAKGVNLVVGRYLHLLLPMAEPLLHIVGNMQFLLAAQHHIHPLNSSNFLAFELGIAPGDHHQRIGIALDEAANVLAALLIRQFRNATRVHHTHLRHIALLRRHNAALGKQCADGGGFGEIEFATQRFYLCSDVVF